MARINIASNIKIVYAMIAKDKTPLYESSALTGNHPEISRQLLKNAIPESVHKRSYQSSQGVTFHYFRDENGYIYLCMTPSSVGRRVPFLFLLDLRDRFCDFIKECEGYPLLYDSIKSSSPGFKHVVEDRVEFFNTNPNPLGKLGDLENKLEELKDVMLDSVDKVIARGEHIEILLKNTQKLQSASFRYKGETKVVRKKQHNKNIYLICALVCMILTILTLVIAIAFIILWLLGVIPISHPHV